MKTKGSSGECDRRDSSFIKIICSDVTTLLGPKLVEFSSSFNDLELRSFSWLASLAKGAGDWAMRMLLWQEGGRWPVKYFWKSFDKLKKFTNLWPTTILRLKLLPVSAMRWWRLPPRMKGPRHFLVLGSLKLSPPSLTLSTNMIVGVRCQLIITVSLGPVCSTKSRT